MTTEENTLHRYYFWAYRLYQDYLVARAKPDQGPDTFMYLSLWLSLLYVTVEGWPKLRTKDPRIQELLRKRRNVDLLREYRHGVMHFNAKYFNDRFARMIGKPEVARWAEELTDAFSAYFARRALETNHPALSGLRGASHPRITPRGNS